MNLIQETYLRDSHLTKQGFPFVKQYTSLAQQSYCPKLAAVLVSSKPIYLKW